MDRSIEEITLLLLSLTAVREETAEGFRQRAPLSYAQTILAGLQQRGLIVAGDDGKVTLTEAGLVLAEELEERYLDSGAHPDLVM